ncbi:uncharacterized secreted protein ARB_06907-like [Lingula anatina]|uniref:Uncharacterized secreted protein ARB_06907-like n=1 Tax=Lingula anatina TaxID=7574 RepID=A0A1S3IK87_LINAN|nr:uncharacterized secreted protein ARB_06907-like [Lingula anatina]|eukprot:XP_013398622.1 uncharacterized secreted protein ARB_06907-like [Lingula anatina]
MHLSWIVITFSLFLAGPTNSKKKDLLKSSTDLLEKESKRLKSSKSGCSLKAINARAIDYLRINNECEKAIPCLIQVLQESGSQTDSWLWASLGHVYQNLQKTALATSSFKQASKLLGKVSSFIKEWHFLGPFVIGKMEVDGDPVAAMGGIANVSANRYKKGWKMFSELISDGEVKWQTHIQKAPGQILQISPDVKWGELVNSLGSVGITEWQGWLVGEFAVTENGQNILLQCEGVNTVLVDGLPIVGDVYHRENFWFSVQLERGIHSIYIRLRTKAVQNVKCEIKITTSSFDILKPHFLPDLIDGYLFTGYIPLPIVNTHSTKWLKNIKITVQEQSDGSDLSVASPHIPYDIAPGQAMPIVIKLISNEAEIVEECIDVMLKLKVSTSEGQLLYPITLRCRRQRESFLFTFVDHDGSVQHAAAIQPLRDCEGGVCPVLLTLHGTTVPPQNQADSYKRMSNGKFIFGLEKAWVLAPTRHGAHNWEGPGALTAMTALNQLEELLKGSKIFRNLASKNHVIFAGHSMGGHGAWHLSTHFPDHALAVISLAGWIKKEEYGDSNLFFRHDIATSHVDAAVKSVMEACISENDADRHASNLKV